ncbi:MAG TPA: alanyl-tRNA editing protein [Vicinamibacterales bacterium]|nr:alanyl-tRNA editing protein [Vicinamibacterales bacterium]
MTDRLYYDDPYVREFDARVIRVEPVDGRSCVTLDRTAFYPTSGGQPFDTGTLNTCRVIDVEELGDGTMVHVVEGAIREGELVRGRIDWPRRFDHMQQHTGQHVLSASCDGLLKARTESFHLGAASATIDLSREVSAVEIEEAEADANRVVWENLPVSIRYADAAEAARMPLRKASSREGVLRLIDVENHDISACGGTHVSRTGAIGIIAVASWEKFRAGTRIEFMCGGRTLAALHALRDTSAASVRLLSVLPAELPAAIERLQGETKASRHRIRDLQGQLAMREADALASSEAESRLVIRVLDGWDQPGLKSIASAICTREGFTAVLIGAPAPSAVVIARAPGATADASALMRQLTERFGGKGGGRRELAQGGGLQGDPSLIAAFARSLLSTGQA